MRLWAAPKLVGLHTWDGSNDAGTDDRDVKPSNILTTEDDFAYLIDFGIARAAGDKRMTATGNVIGSWAYMTPERLSADKVDPRADTYAFACVFHECLTGTQPFPGHSLERQIVGHLNVPPPRPSALRIGLPAQLDAVIATGMAKNPDHRFSTVTEMARAARAAITQTTTHTKGYGAEPVPDRPRGVSPYRVAELYPAAPSGGSVPTDETQYQYIPQPPAGGPRPASGPTGDPIPPVTAAKGARRNRFAGFSAESQT